MTDTLSTTSATAQDTIQQPQPAAVERDARGWITAWNPDDPEVWESYAKRIARRNLLWSVFAEHIGFSVWVLWTIVVVNLGNVGISLTLSQTFWLTALPNLIGSLLRLPYTFAIPRFGGRRWTAMSAALLLIPCTLLAVVVPSGWLQSAAPGTQFWVLLACAATAGVGGGNFSSSMANISFFYPEGKKGLALGINAAGGNVGVAVAQVVVPLVIIIGVPSAAVELPIHQVHLAYAALVWMPLIVIAMLGAWLRMDSLAQARTDTASYMRVVRNHQTWIMSVLYIGTFGSFIGFSFTLPIVIKTTFPEFLAVHPFIATYLGGLAFIGAFAGSVSRPLGGYLADRIGGARVTLVTFIGMALATWVAILGVHHHSFATFLSSYIVVFVLTGIGNGSTYRMIPSIFATIGREDALQRQVSVASSAPEYRRQAAAAIGIAGAVGAFGGFLIQVVLRQSSLHVSGLMKAATTPAQKAAIAAANVDWSVPALWAFIGAYLALGAVTWFCYMRRSVLIDKVPSLAHASV